MEEPVEIKIEHWALDIIPAVFKAEYEVRKNNPEWQQRLSQPDGEELQKAYRDYCKAIATEIVTHQA